MELPLTWNSLFEKELREEIKEHASQVHLNAGEELITSGKNVRFFPIVVKGSLKVIRTDESGRELLLYYIQENESCAMTFSCCMQVFPSQVSIIAVTEATVLTIPTSHMEEWMTRYPTWKSFTMATIRGRFEELLEALDQVVFKNLDDRLIKYLRNQSKTTGSRTIYRSHSDIARELASSREVISRLLKELENQKKLQLYRGQIKLLKGF